MTISRRSALALPLAAYAQQAPSVKRYVRFLRDGRAAYGLMDGGRIRELRGSPLAGDVFSGATHPSSAVKLLYPIEPPKVIAVGLNYKSHLGSNPLPKQPEIFFKPTTCLQNPGDPILIPRDAKNVHYEAELVIVIGKKLRNASLAEAQAGIFGYTCGNDVSERDWQKGDLQWWRAKGTDTFGPMGPMIATGLDISKSGIELRLNGETRQKQVLSDLIFDCPTCVQHISRYVTLEPGDVIFTGTPGTTAAMKPGDTVEVEIGGIGMLRNPVKAA